MPANSDGVAFAVGAHLLRSGDCLYCVGSQMATTHSMGLAPGDGINPSSRMEPAASRRRCDQWQWVMVLALPITVALQRRGRCVWAGIALSLLLVEPQTIWPALPMLLAAREWRTLTGFVLGASGWLAASLRLVGPSQLARWPGFLIQTHLNDARMRQRRAPRYRVAGDARLPSAPFSLPLPLR
ncbi:MAG: glycosyltransferase 87 family protein [Candidatus Dormibacteria bacterium]